MVVQPLNRDVRSGSLDPVMPLAIAGVEALPWLVESRTEPR